MGCEKTSLAGKLSAERTDEVRPAGYCPQTGNPGSLASSGLASRGHLPPRGEGFILTFSITPKGRRRVCPAAALLWVCYSLDLVEVGVNGAVVLRLRTGIGAGLCTGLLALCLGGLLVDLLADGVEAFCRSSCFALMSSSCRTSAL